MKQKSGIHRIGLVSPCSGNLGNAAIMSSMVANIRLRIPDAEIVGITLSPEDTRRRHGIDTFPITGASHGDYHLVCDGSRDGTQQQSSRQFGVLREWLKGIGPIRASVRGLRAVWSEVAHGFKSARLVRRLDRVIISGGGALDDFWGGPWGHPWTLLKFALLSRIFGVPFLFVSVGKCSLDHRLSRFFVRRALSMAQYRSYRDFDSKAAVQAIFPSPADPVCPDLAYRYAGPEVRESSGRAARSNRLRVAVSPICFCDPRVWPLKDEQRYLRYVRELAGMVEWLIEQGCGLLFFTTDEPDAETTRDLMKLLAAGSVDTRTVRVLPSPGEQTTEGLLSALQDVDLVVASRLHGVILSHLIAKPTLAISYDPKIDTHMKEIEQTEYCVSIDHFDSTVLIERFIALRDARERESIHLARAVEHYSELVGLQYDLLFGGMDPASHVDGMEGLSVAQERL